MFKKLIKVLGLSVVALILLNVFLSIVFNISILKYFDYSKSKSTQLLVYKNNGEDFNIPRNFFWSWTKLEGNQIFQPNLHFIYPEMEGVTEQNKALFEKGRAYSNKVVTFTFSPNGRFTMAEIVQRELNRLNQTDVKETTSKFEIYRNSGFQQDTYFPTPINENNFYFNCRQKTELFKYSSCSVLFEFSPSLKINATFSSEQLKNGTQIVESIRDLLSSFK